MHLLCFWMANFAWTYIFNTKFSNNIIILHICSSQTVRIFELYCSADGILTSIGHCNNSVTCSLSSSGLENRQMKFTHALFPKLFICADCWHPIWCICLHNKMEFFTVCYISKKIKLFHLFWIQFSTLAFINTSVNYLIKYLDNQLKCLSALPI